MLQVRVGNVCVLRAAWEDEFKPQHSNLNIQKSYADTRCCQ
jgi:hypothetical protein